MNNEKQIRNLEDKIAELEKRIAIFHEKGISDKKVQRLEMLKLKIETQLEELKFA